MDRTVKCVRCLSANAVLWTGHLTNGPQAILAGWCDPCHKESDDPDGPQRGWVGHYIMAMDARPEICERAHQKEGRA